MFYAMRASLVLLLLSWCSAPASAITAKLVPEGNEPAPRALLSSRDDLDEFDLLARDKKKKKKKENKEKKSDDSKKKKKGKKSDKSEEPSHNAIWKPEWMTPGGEEIANNRRSACLCYAEKGADTHADQVYWHTQQEVEVECESYCHDLDGGPYHAGDYYGISYVSTRRPAIIVIHGSDADKDEKNIVGVCEFLRDAGYQVLSINYHSADCAQDIGNAVALIKVNAEEFGVDPDSVGLYGWSLGAQCAYQAGFNNAYDPLMSVKVVVDSSGCGGKGPVKSVKELTTPPPALVLVHAENDNTIPIQECYDLAAKAKDTQWKNDGKKTDIILEEWYFSSGGHNLWKNQEKAFSDIMYDAYVKYLGRPCRIESSMSYRDPEIPPVDSAWPVCKHREGESIEKCGGIYSDPSLLGATCDYP